MDSIQTPDQPVFDRRLIYRPFLERLNPIASMRTVLEQELDVAPGSDPRDPMQPAIHEAFAGLDVPVVFGMRYGHTSGGCLTLPIGVRARLSARETVQLTLLEPAVSAGRGGTGKSAATRKRMPS